jgi:hypothetical protein
METSKDYRKFAQECRSLARQIGNAEHKLILDQMAEVWLRLAEQAERIGPAPNRPDDCEKQA